ncbi:MAG: hypothetical protein AAGH53_10215 [Pseudomonadota bacterium]
MILPNAFRLCLLAIASLSLSGCVAALLPLAAAGAIGKSEIDRRREAGLIAAAAPLEAGTSINQSTAAPYSKSGVGGGPDALESFGDKAQLVDTPSENNEAIKALSAEYDAATQRGSAFTVGAYAPWARYALDTHNRFQAGEAVTSAVLVPRVSLSSPKAVDCQDKPSAVVIDIDDGSPKPDAGGVMTALDDTDVLATQLDALRAAEITIIWLSGRDASDAAALQNELRAYDLLPEGVEDYLSLNRGTEDRKQIRRWETAELFCVLAVAGDARGDFDELYDYLLKPDYAFALENKFGAGWFTLSSPETVAAGEPGPITAAPETTPYSESQKEE